MSNNPRTTLTPSVATGSQSKPSGGLVPTNNVTTKDGVTVRARIDPTLTVEDVVRQLCVNLKVTDPSSHFALRDRDTDELVTNDNLRKKIKNKAHLRSFVSLSSSANPRSLRPSQASQCFPHRGCRNRSETHLSRRKVSQNVPVLLAEIHQGMP